MQNFRNKFAIKVGGVLLVLLSGCAWFLSAQSHGEGSTSIFPLVSLSPIVGQQNELSTVSATVLLNEVQRIKSGGINLTLQLQNDSDKDVAILSPLDFIRINLSSKSGDKVALPTVPSRFRVNNGSQSPEALLPFKVSSISLNGKRVPTGDLYKFPFVLKSKSKLRIPITIDKVVKGSSRIEPISPGDYSVSISIILAVALHNDRSRGFESPLIPARLIK